MSNSPHSLSCGIRLSSHLVIWSLCAMDEHSAQMPNAIIAVTRGALHNYLEVN